MPLDGGNWALGTVTRTLTIRETGRGNTGYIYTATVSDTGTFDAILHALAPNQGGSNHGKRISSAVQGIVTGTASYSFSASSQPRPGRNLGVPGSENGAPVASSPQTTSLWYEQAFPRGTTFGGTGLGTYNWTYVTGSSGSSGSSGRGCTQGGNGGKNLSHGDGWLTGGSQGDGRRDRGRSPGCTCGDNHNGSRGGGNDKGKGCTQGHDNRGGTNGRNGTGRSGTGGSGSGRGGRNGNQGRGQSPSTAEKWVDASNNGHGQQPADGNITGS